MLYPSSRNPPAWIGKIHGISFVDTSAQIPPVTSHSQLHHAGFAKREGGLSSTTSPRGMRSPIPLGSPISSPAVLGLTGDGCAALFGYSRQEVDPRGYVDHIHLKSQATGIDSPAALLAWVEETLATIPA